MSPSISAHDLAEQLHTQRIAVIDVREPMEYASGHIAGSLNVPLARLHQANLPRGPLVLHTGIAVMGGGFAIVPALVLLAGLPIAQAWLGHHQPTELTSPTAPAITRPSPHQP